MYFPFIFILQTGGFYPASTVRIIGEQSHPFFKRLENGIYIHFYSIFILCLINSILVFIIIHTINKKIEILNSVKKKDTIKVMKEVLTVAKQAKRQFISKPNIFSAKMDPCYL
jgi:hypothetical protein